MKKYYLLTTILFCVFTLQAANYGLIFDGSNDYCTLTSPDNAFRPTSKVTVEAWIFPDTQGSYEGIFTNLEDTSVNESGYGLYFYGGELRFWVAIGSGSGQGEYVSTTVNNGRWYHVAGVYDGSYLRLYINGTQVSSKSQTGSINYSYMTGNSHPRIGVYADSNEELYYDGRIDEVRVWSDARTSSEINAYMHKSIINGTNPGNLICSISMNEGSGTTLDDRSSNNNSFTINGATWSSTYAAPVGDFDAAYDSYAEALWYNITSSPSVDSYGLTVSTSGFERMDSYSIGPHSYLSSLYSGITSSDCPSGVELRAKRIWYIEDNADEAVNFVFDLSDFASDLYDSELEYDDYKLLKRTGVSGTFTSVKSGTGINGDQITFFSYAPSSGYYTIGRDNDPATVTTTAISGIGTTVASSGGNVTADGGGSVTTRGVCWSTSTSPTTSNSHTSDGSGTGSFTSSITGLSSGTTYYVRAFATNSEGTVYGEQVSFRTIPNAPTANAASSLTSSSFTANWSSSTGVTSYRLDVSTSSNFSSYVSGYQNVSVSATSKSVTGLSAGTYYYYRVRAVNASGTSGNSSTITAKTYITPTVTTQSVTSISTSTAIGNGNVTSLGVPNPTQHGHCWSTSSSPTISSSHTSLGTKNSTGAFTSSITGLSAGTTYYVRAYATNSAGTVYGNQVSFTALNTPTVTTQSVTSISTSTATGNGNVTSLGVPNPTQHGHCWSTSSSPTTSSSHTSLGAKNSTGAFTSSITGLSAGITYYVRAYATNLAGTVYGNQVSFTALNTPTVTTQSVTSISTSTATGNGNVTSLGVPNPTQHGHCWSTSSSPTTSSSHTSLGAKNSPGAFTSSITGLSAGTTYYVRSYATNSVGTVYGSNVSFVTVPNAPTANAASSLTSSSFTANWSSSTGATSYRLDVSTSSNFSSYVSGYQNVSVSTTSKSVTGLSAGTYYYYRVRAVNASGTSGNSSTITAKTYITPTVTTQSVTSISTSTATGNGNVTSLGVPNPTQHGHCWSTSSSPTISNSKTTLGAKSSTGAFTSSITGLSAGTTYYVRAYATNLAGTVYGDQVSFTALNTPTVTTQSVTSISTSTATGNGNVTSLGIPNPTQHGHCWSTSSSPTTSSSHTSLGAKNSTGAFTSSITGLTAGTTYYVRSYATNSVGTVYGSNVSFVTVPNAPTANAASSLTSSSFTANWSSSTGATSYKLDVSTSSNFSSYVSGYQNVSVSGTSKSVTGLSAGTYYYYRVRAVNASGTSGNSSAITAKTYITPTVTTQSVTSISTSTATGNGNVTSLGVPNPTQHGHCWSTSSSPTISNSKTTLGANSSTGAFTSSITGLTAGTTYYVRAYATNSVGTVYGNQVSFTALNTPTVTTQSVTSISTSTATGNGNVTSLGVPNPTQHGHCWSTSSSPTTSSSHTSLGAKNSTGAFTSSITGLSAGTTYYVRSYATNSVGTVYGDQVSFTTLPAMATNIFPANGSTNMPRTVTINWRYDGNGSPTGFKVLQDDLQVGSTVVWSGDILYSKQLNQSAWGATIDWQVIPYNDSGDCDCPIEWSFTVMSEPVEPTQVPEEVVYNEIANVSVTEPPTLTLPAIDLGEGDVSPTVDFTFASAPDNVTVSVQVQNQPNHALPIPENCGVSLNIDIPSNNETIIVFDFDASITPNQLVHWNGSNWDDITVSSGACFGVGQVTFTWEYSAGRGEEEFAVNLGGESALPVTLSSFSALFIQQPKLFWTTQSESGNAGWHVWRSEEDDYASAQQISVDLIAGAGSCTVPTEYQFTDQAVYQAGCQYYYWLESISIAGESELHGPITLTIPQGSMQSPPTPQVYGLMQNHPNPFNPCTEINFALPQSAHCTIDVYNISGRKVITLIDEVVTANVMHTVIWQGDDAQGNPVASGIYLYKMRAGKYTAIKKMMMMK